MNYQIDLSSKVIAGASVMAGNDEDGLHRIIEDTKEYYRKRAPQYADWSRRTGRYEGGFNPGESWFAEAKILTDALERCRLEGDVLEIACGTGVMTEILSRSAGRVTALDSSQEMIERSKERLGGNPKVNFTVADFYKWKPDRWYDAVTFAFWISHVPTSKLDDFVSKVSRCLKPGGRVFFVDQLEEARKNETFVGSEDEVVMRTLEDGREFRIFKHFYSAEEIEECFRRKAIKLDIARTPTHFFYATGKKVTGWD